MRSSRLFLATLVAALVLIGAANSYADISNAAVLFLRIAPGSRAAGMGEAYVALADDATATHWNPAGLGSYPLSDDWVEARVPQRMRHIKDIAVLAPRNGKSYLDYEIWAVSDEGLLRYDEVWTDGEVFETKTSETLRDKLNSYFNEPDEERLDMLVKAVARANSDESQESFDSLMNRVREIIPEDYDARDRLMADLDTLSGSYNRCLIDWDQIAQLRDRLETGFRDSSLTSTESDRIAIAVERAINRFLPEELVVPYATFFQGEITSIASDGRVLLVGTTEGVAKYSGTNWSFESLEEYGVSSEVTCMESLGRTILIGTTDGLAGFDGLTFSSLGNVDQGFPTGAVQAVGGKGRSNAYVLVNNDLYFYDGTIWRNHIKYTVRLDESLDDIAAKFAIYGTPAEKAAFIEKQAALAPVLESIEEAKATVTPTEDSAAESTEMTADEMVDAANEAESTEAEDTSSEVAAGRMINVPLLSDLHSTVNSIYVDDNGNVWLGTSDGIFRFDGARWTTPGYADYTVDEAIALDSLALRRAGSDEAAGTMADRIRSFNQLESDELAVGQVVKIPKNPAARNTTAIVPSEDGMLFATSAGLIVYNDRGWNRSDMQDLGRTGMADLFTYEGEVWMATPNKVVLRSRGRSEIALMHVNWLPELADDLFYEYLGVVTQVKGWGTFGMNFTFISYGKFTRTGETGIELGEFESFDLAATVSYGTSLSRKWKAGVSAKIIYSRLADQGAGIEQGNGTSTGFAVDLGLLYYPSSRLNFGLALTNLGPKMAYIDAAQSDDLPRNLAIGFAYKILTSRYAKLMVTGEVNKMMVGIDDGFSQELKEVVLNGGGEFTYADLISARLGYIFDEEGEIKAMTLGAGLKLFDRMKFDFAYIPSQKNVALANTLRISLGIIL